ncbi:MAG TPA: VWA domain-containing protein [Armatimonadota bacterium]|nr:VWA domain-containing protein [Armatimonadota bacterium]
MQALAPLALIAFIPLAGAVILLYLLKLRRRDFVVPSVFLWRRAVQDVQANAPFQKLRTNLLLILQLLALAALVAGLAGPYFFVRRLGGKSTIIVLDASASMKATDARGSRFAEGKQLAEEIVTGMGRRDEAALLVCSDHPRMALSFSQDRGRLLSAIREAEATDCATNIRDGLLLACSLAAKRPESRIYLLSDGAFSGLPAVASSAEFHFLRVGGGSDNVALLAFEATRPRDAREHQLFLRVHNYSSERKHVVLSIAHEGDLFHAGELDLDPGEDRSENYQLTLEKPGLLRAELEVEDDLACDNVCYAFAEPPSALSLLLVTPGNLFLEQALLVLPEVEVFKASSLSAAEAEAAYREYDIVIFDRAAVPKAPDSGAVMLIGTDLEAGAALGPEVASPSVTSWEDQHPALRYVNLSAVQMATARRLVPGPGAVVLARAGEDPVIVAREAPGVRLIAFGWDFLDSDLPLRVGFPVLLSNTIQWLSQTAGRAATMRVRPGTILYFPAPPEVEEGELALPDGGVMHLAAVEGRITFAESDQVGVYDLSAGERRWRWAVDLRSAEESDLTPADEVRLGEREVRAGVGPPKVEQHLWPVLAAFALVVLFGEWHLYHRRY